MQTAIAVLPDRQLEALNSAYRTAVRRRKLRTAGIIAACVIVLLLSALGADVNLSVFVSKIGNFTSYFNRLLTLDTGKRVWTDFQEWFWGWRLWLRLLGETILISYVGTLLGAVLAFVLCFFTAQNTAPSKSWRFGIQRTLEFCRTVPDIVFALIFVIAFGLGPMAGVLAIAVHCIGALGKQFSEIVENIDMKPIEGLRSTGAGWISAIRFGALPQVASGFASYTLLRFEINVRGASVMGFVGAGGIGQELIVAIRKFYYSDVSAILVMIIFAVFLIDIGTEWVRTHLLGKEQRA